MEKEYILCAAIHFNDSKEYLHQPKNIKEGFVLCGRRHHNCITNLTVFGKKMADYKDKTQGFITSKDKFVNRSEASIIAEQAGQIKACNGTLFSEDLY